MELIVTWLTEDEDGQADGWYVVLPDSEGDPMGPFEHQWEAVAASEAVDAVDLDTAGEDQ